jgi:hypothetical protein
MNIRVVKCATESYWYSSCIGQTFEALPETGRYPDSWEVWRDKNCEAKGYIFKCDAEVVDVKNLTDTDKMVDLLNWLWDHGMLSVVKMDPMAIVGLYNECRAEEILMEERHVGSDSKG